MSPDWNWNSSFDKRLESAFSRDYKTGFLWVVELVICLLMIKRSVLSDEILYEMAQCLNKIASLESVFLDIGLYDNLFERNNILIGLWMWLRLVKRDFMRFSRIIHVLERLSWILMIHKRECIVLKIDSLEIFLNNKTSIFLDS